MSLFDSDTLPVRWCFHLKDPHPRMMVAVMTQSLSAAVVTLRQHHADGDPLNLSRSQLHSPFQQHSAASFLIHSHI